MMEPLQSYDIDLEDGELSNNSDDVYTPLQRPSNALKIPHSTSNASADAVNTEASPLATCHQMQCALEEDESQADSSDDSSSGELSSDACLKKLTTESADTQTQRKRVRRTVMMRVSPTTATAAAAPEIRKRFKKYNVWTEALQEEALTENMRGCDVTQKGVNDRNVENYDFTLRYRLNGENRLKRRLSNSTDDFSDNDLHPPTKRGRPSSRDATESSQRRSVKSRLGHRSHVHRGRRDCSSATSGSDNSYEPRIILDLAETLDRDAVDVAREIATKLYEENEELMERIVEVLGTDLPIEIYKETQRIEADGGMMVMNGNRRRTPGGVFLFLLKNHEHITDEQQKSIFAEQQHLMKMKRKAKKSRSRDRKVEELKKRLSEQEKDLPALSARKELILLGSDLSPESEQVNLSNPPPSPVGQEHSPEYKKHAINHVASDVSSEKPSTSASALASLTSTTSDSKDLLCYDDDFLDVNCGEMDFF